MGGEWEGGFFRFCPCPQIQATCPFTGGWVHVRGETKRLRRSPPRCSWTFNTGLRVHVLGETRRGGVLNALHVRRKQVRSAQCSTLLHVSSDRSELTSAGNWGGVLNAPHSLHSSSGPLPLATREESPRFPRGFSSCTPCPSRPEASTCVLKPRPVY